MTTQTDQQQLNKERLGKLLRMLSSDQDGEVLAAVRALDRALKAAGKSFNDLAEMLSGKVVFVEAPKTVSRHYAEACRWLLKEHEKALTEKETNFIKDMERRFKFDMDFTPSPKQAAWFTLIVKRMAEKATT